MGGLARKARREQERAAWKAEPVERMVPPPGVPARHWIDIIAEHGELLARLEEADEQESEPLIAELTAAINARTAEDAATVPEGDEGNADRMELLLERYAAFVVGGESEERAEFESGAEMIVEFATGEGKDIFARFLVEERRLRMLLPRR